MTNSGKQSADRTEVAQVVCEVRRRLINLGTAELDDEFFPAHLSIALIDAIFNPRVNYQKHVVPIINRYCRAFELDRVRAREKDLPLVDEQETLTDLIDHYGTHGAAGMQTKIFKAGFCSPGTTIPKSTNVRCAALKLREAGIETLQDAMEGSRAEIKRILRPLKGIGDRTINMFLMYSGHHDVVKGDVRVCRFVARALRKDRVSSERAERLVADAARELGVTPCLLDNEIWREESGSRCG